LHVIRAFRAAHAGPLQRVAANLRYYVEQHSTGRPIVVGQRLKRLTTIADKLCRQPKMQLARMHDIGGCRAVVSTEAEIREIVTHVRRRWEIVRGYDYIAEPKAHSGYRAYHLVVAKNGRLIEVQLRTATQHRWAELIEIVDRRNPGIGLKGGSGPADLVEYYRLGSELLAADERGEPAEPATVARFRELHEQVAGYHGPTR
jgi:ppGpp synthetase/RelA/SpoT-type nucleotidyltranferase